MADTATTRGRLRKQTLASNVNIWGDPYLNTNFDLLDQQIDGVTTIALGTSTGTTLTSTNYASDQQRNKVWVFTGTGTQTCTATVPQVEQVKLIVNQSSGPVVIAPAAGTAVTVAAGERALIYCDGTNFGRGDPTLDKVRAPTASVSLNSQRITSLADPSSLQDAATKNYVDLAMTSGAAGATFLTVSTNSILQNARVLTPAANELYLSTGTAGGTAAIGLATDTVAFGTRTLTGGTWSALQVSGTATASALSVSGTSTTVGLAVSSAVTLPSAGVATAALASSALRALGATTPTVDTVPYFVGTASAGTTALTTFARTLLAGTDAAAMRSTLVALATNGDGSAVTVTPTGGYSAATLATLTGAIQTVARRAVIMARTSDSGSDPSVNPATWKVLKPDGTLLSTVGSTSQGFQEGLNYAIANGFNFVVDGGAVGGTYPSGVDGAVIQCTAPITFPPMQKGYVSIRGATLNFGGSPAGSPFAITIDSCMMARVEWPGSQIVAYNSAYAGALLFDPTNELPQDAAGPVITDSEFDLPTTVPYTGKICVKLNAASYGIGSNDFRIREPNGGATGVQVVAGAGSGAFYGNRLKIVDCHAQTTVGVTVGTSTTGATNIFGNRWDIECDPGTGATGLIVYGTKDIYTVSVSNNEGTPTTGIDLKSSAANNVFTIVKNDATARIADASSGTNVGMYGPLQPAFQAIMSGDQTVNTATVTKVGFSVTLFNVGGSLSGGAWTPGMVGKALISAQVTWNASINDQTMQVKIYKNGSEYKTNISALTTTAQQAIAITTIVEVTATTDTFEVYVVFYGGTTLDISSNNKITYFTGAML